MGHDRNGVVKRFVRLALDGSRIPLYGGGLVRRSFLYMDDAVDAMIRCALDSKAQGRLLNVGSGSPCTLRRMAETIIRIAGTGRLNDAPYSLERRQVEPGDVYTDISAITAVTGWRPVTTLEDGLEKTIAFYQKYGDRYWRGRC